MQKLKLLIIWFQTTTGDIAKWSSNGTIQFIDRKSHLIRLNNGILIAPQSIEKTFQLHSLVDQIFIHGDENAKKAVAIVITDKEAFYKSFHLLILEHLMKNELLCELNQLIEDENHKLGDIHVDFTAFSVSNGLLTQTQKLRRGNIYQKYKTELDAMLKIFKQ